MTALSYYPKHAAITAATMTAVLATYALFDSSFNLSPVGWLMYVIASFLVALVVTAKRR